MSLLSGQNVVFLDTTISIWATSWENLYFGMSEQQIRRPARADAQSDQRLCCSLLK